MSKHALVSILMAAALLGARDGAVAQPRPEPVVEGETIGTPELAASACAEGQVVYYTAQSDTDERRIVEAFEKQFPCLKVAVISAVSGRLYERVLTEAQAGKPQGDVAMLTDEGLAQKLVEQKKVRPWTPPMAAKYPDNAKAQGWWYAGSGSLMLPFYNTELVRQEDAPKSWKDLLDPKWKGRLATSPITIGGTAWMQYDFMLERLGEDYLKGFAAQEPKLFTAYNPVVLAVARGESAVGVTAALNEYSLRVEQGAPTRPVYPPEGLPYTNYPMMLLADAPHPHAAELFGNWYLSRLGQSRLVAARGAYSVRDDVAPAKGNPPLAGLKPWNPGHAAIVQNHAAVIEKVTGLFGRR